MKWKKDLIRGSQSSELSNEIKSINRTEWPKKSLQIHYSRFILMVLICINDPWSWQDFFGTCYYVWSGPLINTQHMSTSLESCHDRHVSAYLGESTAEPWQKAHQSVNQSQDLCDLCDLCVAQFDAEMIEGIPYDSLREGSVLCVFFQQWEGPNKKEKTEVAFCGWPCFQIILYKSSFTGFACWCCIRFQVSANIPMLPMPSQFSYSFYSSSHSTEGKTTPFYQVYPSIPFYPFTSKVPMSPISWSKGKGQTIAAHEVSQIPLSHGNIVQHVMTCRDLQNKYVKFHIWHAQKPDRAFHDDIMNSLAHTPQLGGELWAAILCGNITYVHVGSATWQLKVCTIWSVTDIALTKMGNTLVISRHGLQHRKSHWQLGQGKEHSEKALILRAADR